jgi:hypothetical protein
VQRSRPEPRSIASHGEKRLQSICSPVGKGAKSRVTKRRPERRREIARKAGKGSATASAPHLNPAAKDVPETARTIRSYFPSTRDRFVEELAAEARRIEPTMSDQELARILKETYKPDLRTPKPWMDPVSEYLFRRIDADLDRLERICWEDMTDPEAERYHALAGRFPERERSARKRLVAQLIKIPFEEITEETLNIFLDLSCLDVPGLCEAEWQFRLAAFKIAHHLTNEAFARLREEFEVTTLSEIKEFQLQNDLTEEDLDMLFTFVCPRCAVCSARPEAPHSDGLHCFCYAHCQECAVPAWRRSMESRLGSALWKEVVLGRANWEMLGADLWRELQERDPELFARNNRETLEPAEETRVAAPDGHRGEDGQALFPEPEVDGQQVLFGLPAATAAAGAPKNPAAEGVPLTDADLDRLEGINLEDMTDDEAERYQTLVERFPERERSARERLLVRLISTPFDEITKESCDAFWNLALDNSIPWMPGVCEAYHRFALAACKMGNDLTDEEFSRFREEGASFPYSYKLELRTRYHLTENAFNNLSELAFASCDSCGAKPDALHSTRYGHFSVPSGYFCEAHCPACAGIDRPDRMPLLKLDAERVRAVCRLNDQVQLTDDIFGARHEFPLKVAHFGWVGGGVFISPARYYDRSTEELTETENSGEKELILLRTAASARALYQLYEQRSLLQKGHDTNSARLVTRQEFDEPPGFICQSARLDRSVRGRHGVQRRPIQ